MTKQKMTKKAIRTKKRHETQKEAKARQEWENGMKPRAQNNR